MKFLLGIRRYLYILAAAAFIASNIASCNYGQGLVQAKWDKSVEEQRVTALEESTDNLEIAQDVIVKYIEVEKPVYRDRPVIRDRIIRLCEDEGNKDLPATPSDTASGNAGTQDDAGASQGAAGEGATVEGLAEEIPQAVSAVNQCAALIEYIQRVYNKDE